MAKREEWIRGKKKNFENPVADILKGVIKPILSLENKLEVDLKMNWKQVTPKEAMKFCSFKKLKTLRNGGEKKLLLEINVKPEKLIEVSYMKQEFLEKINLFFGYNVISDIKFVKTT